MTESVDRALAYQVFCEALEADASKRDAIIAERCRQVPGLERTVRGLLATAQVGEATGILVKHTAPALPDRIGLEYGRFRLLELVGAGGMGAVYRAERTDGVPQTVAVKVLRDTIVAANSTHFAREARILAGLEHPSIARLIDVGVREREGWIAMEFVHGQTITAYCEAAALDTASRVQLLIAVADAIATAHRRLIVHRDIKPSNVLVTDEGQPKLIDFGIAYALQQAGSVREATADVSRLFSPHFAAPEQVTGEPVTVATDVFGLGALGYRLLAGCDPFAQETTAVGYALAVTRNDLDRPSDAARAAGASPALVRTLKGDLDAILMKALDREPSRRYAGVDRLQADLRAYLEGRPVRARRATWRYVSAKFARRYAWGLGLGTVALLGLIVVGVVYALQERRVTQALEASARRGAFLESMLKSADPRHNGNREITVAQVLDASLKNVDELSAKEPLAAASMLGLVADTDRTLGRFREGVQANDRQIQLLRAQPAAEVALADALRLRGELLISLSDDAGAEVPLREALHLLEHRRNVEPQIAGVLEGLAKATQNQGRSDKAEQLYRREIAINERVPEAVGGKAGFPLAGLASIRFYQGRFAESVAYVEQSLKIQRQYLPPDNPDMLDGQYNYAVALEADHQAAKAEPIFRGLLESYRRILGPDHSDTYGAQAGLAHDLYSQQRYAEAAEEALQAATGLSRTVGEQNGWTDTAWGIYGISTCLAGHGDEGLEALRRSVAMRAKKSGADSPWAMRIGVHLGVCLLSVQRYAEAEPVLLHAVAVLETSGDDNLERMQAGYRALGDLYAATGRADEAARWRAKLAARHPTN